MLGNDDLAVYDSIFDRFCNECNYIRNIARRKISVDGYEFIGLDLVVDYPFRLKDRCRKDTSKSTMVNQYGPGLLSDVSGKFRVIDWSSYINQLPSIEEELENLPKPVDLQKSVYVIHMPPVNCNLDVLNNRSVAGSKAVYDFLQRTQPLLSLHGHIHESPDISGVWKSNIGRTICIQPGQKSAQLCYVVIDLDKMEFERKIL
jgi:hypothetical protein